MPPIFSPHKPDPTRIGLDAVSRATIETAVAVAYAVPIREMRAPSRGRASAALARQVAMYLAHVVLGLNYSAIGRAFGRDRTTVAHACQRVEDHRDDPNTDSLLSMLECLLGSLAHEVRV
jgi:chromosomal replication initiation ATPase DnaA